MSVGKERSEELSLNHVGVSREDYERASERLKEKMGEENFNAWMQEINAPDFMKKAERYYRRFEAEKKRKEGYKDYYDELGPNYLIHAGNIHRDRILNYYSLGEISLLQTITLAASDLIYRKLREPFKLILRMADSIAIGWDKGKSSKD